MSKHLSRSTRKKLCALIEPLEVRKLLSLVVDVRLVGGGKDHTLSSVGEVVNLEVFATVSGTDASGANEGLAIVAGSFLSTNLGAGAALGNMVYTRVAPFNAPASSDGVQADLDSDGDLDVGSNNDASAAGFFVARANPTATGGAVSGASMEFKIATGTFTVASLLAGAQTDIVFRPRSTATSFLYIMDGAAVNGSNGGTVAGGAPLILRPPAPVGGSISGQKFNDLDGDGGKDAGEPGLDGWTIELDAGADGSVDATTLTSGGGSYSFADLAPSTYRIREVGQSGWIQTTVNPTDVALVAGADSTGNDFGNFQLGAISGIKFEDNNGNGVKNGPDGGLAGWTIELDKDANGTVDATTVTAPGGLYSFTGLTAGVYRIREVGQTGWIQTTVNPTDVTVSSGTDSTGNHFGNFDLITISGQKFNDASNDGIKDAGEGGVAGVTIFLDADNDGLLDGGETSTTTDAGGNYSFTDVVPGTYRVREVTPVGSTQTTPNPATFNAISGTNVSGIDFGNFTPAPLTGSISGQKFDDLDGDGVNDAGEPGVSGVTINLDKDANGSVDATTITNAGGNYTFSGLVAGIYRVREVAPTDTVQTTTDPTDITLATGQSITAIDFGNFRLGSISGMKFDDQNGDGLMNGSDAGIAGWTIELDKDANGTVDATTVTAPGGGYSFTGLTAGVYRIREIGQGGWTQTSANPADVSVSSGTHSTGNHFGNFDLITVSGQKFNDLDGDGVRDSVEGGLAGVTINLDKDADGSIDATTTTDASGNYAFNNLGPGTYRVREVVPPGSTQTTADPSDLSASSGSNITGVDFGNFTPVVLYSISGTKFTDLTGDGVSAGDTPLGLVTINLYLDVDHDNLLTATDGSAILTTVTDGNGLYSFANLAPGDYIVAEVVPNGYVQTAPTGGIHNAEITTSDITGLNFANFQLITIAGYKFNDLDGDGIEDAGEGRVGGVTINLDRAPFGSIDATTVTNASGQYSFVNLGPGVYRVREVVPTGSTQTTPNPADLSAQSGQNYVNVNFGNRVNPTPTGPAITGYKFDDLDGDGKWDTDEPGLAGVVINLDRDANGSVNATTVTDSNGYYAFHGLSNNRRYRIREVQPTGTVRTTSNPSDITVRSNKTYTNVNFGNFTLFCISGQKFNDLNGNGVKESGEEGVKGIKITLDSGANGTVNATTYTDANGSYSFIKLGPGVYRIREVVPSGSVQTTVNPADIYGVSGTNVTDVDFGNHCPPPPPPPPGATIEVVNDPHDPALTALRISGNENGENIEVLFTDQQGKAAVKINGVNQGTFTFTGSIFVYGNGGDDNIHVSASITRPAYLFGGEDDDYLSGGSGSDVLLGEAGNDSLYGNAARDILIGGADHDTLNGGEDEDIVIGGRTAYDSSLPDLGRLTDEWRRTDRLFADRVISIRTGGGLNGTTALSASNVFDDLANDASSGGNGMDLFYSKYTGPSANQDDGPDYNSGYDRVFDV